jgi:hypothetical protein
MSALRRPLACFAIVVLALVAAATAVAGRGDPQEKFNPADQARAKAMLVRVSDLPGAAGKESSQPDTDFYCKALDESALTITGEAESPEITRGLFFASSLSQVYRSRRESEIAWRQGTSAAGVSCLREGFRREVSGPNGKFVSFRRIPFPRVAERTAAFRVAATTQGVPFTLDVVVLMQSRAQQALVTAVVGSTPPRAEVVRLARVVGGRMKTAMRGA